MELVVVGDEGLGSRAAVDRLQDGGFHFQEALTIQEFPQGADHRGTLAEDLAHLGVDRQVGIALAEAGFRIGQGGVADDLAIHHLILGGRQGGDGLGQHGEGGDVDRDLAGAGAEQGAGGLDEIAQVEFLVEELELLLAQVVDPQEELDARRWNPRCGRR